MKAALLNILRNYGQFGFPLSRKTWNWLELQTFEEMPEELSPAKEVYFLRRLADRINQKRAASARLPQPVHGGELTSISVLIDILRYIIELYSHEEQPGVIPRGLKWTEIHQSQATVIQPPPSFVKLFPPSLVLRGQQSDTDFLVKALATTHSFDTIIREIILLFLSMTNPALKPYRLLFDDTDLKTETPYEPLVKSLEKFFSTQPPFKPVGLTLFECLYAPIRDSSDSLEGQLHYIRRNWAHFLPLELLERLLLAIDVLEEERTLRGLGPGPLEALRFDHDAYGIDLAYGEPAAFSRDADWMSNVVLIAKSIYVWLYQLSRKYQRNISILSDIPDEELDQLARWGFSGLWLIGLWERSSASQKIKQMMGNPEAAASAYSLYDYIIAHDLGGEEAFQQLKKRAWQRGIRLASDMVPNHMGIYSKWVIEHPQWFLQTSYPPFPVYQYTGNDLSDDPRVCIQIEDGYWHHRDAAVVFKRIDKWTGDTRYIYHGNDGTSMPWNDTAQLNFLLPEVREAVIQTILHVARKFPIIRFDAAMTLAKRHYQRLWFPQPGEGGAIPSRAEHGMTRAQFDAHLPKEFWREVVDRVAKEVPDTLLLAEAFWLMEGYFVRTLGMHRVYNSAFMNMLKMEDNAKYRTTVKNVLEFSPEVLKRFVNFMNNPDERTAVDQFGRGDKYFGVAVLMVTMPGLPMFGHGQIEGFTEKYGMEYRRSYWDEQVDWDMVRRHETAIFPLMRRRHLFSGAANFAFYDFITSQGWVDENVMAYSNRAGHERAVILYNNAYNTTSGYIHTSTAINIGENEQTRLIRRTLAEALALNNEANCFYTFRDYQSGLEYIRSSRDIFERGLFAQLHAYQYHAFLDFREIHDTDGSWWALNRRLNGAGVPNIDEARRELQFEPLLKPYQELMNPDMLHTFDKLETTVSDKYKTAVFNFYTAVKQYIDSPVDIEPLVEQFMKKFTRLLESQTTDVTPKIPTDTDTISHDTASPTPTGCSHIIIAFLSLEALETLSVINEKTSTRDFLLARIEEWLLPKVIRQAFDQYLSDRDRSYWDSRLVLVLLSRPELPVPSENRSLGEAFQSALVIAPVREYLQIHMYNDILWLNKERLERMLEVLTFARSFTATPSSPDIADLSMNKKQILATAEKADYQVEKMITLLAGTLKV